MERLRARLPSSPGGLCAADTCFALLSLGRATSASTGRTMRRLVKFYRTTTFATGVGLRASGDDPLALWLEATRKAREVSEHLRANL